MCSAILLNIVDYYFVVAKVINSRGHVLTRVNIYIEIVINKPIASFVCSTEVLISWALLLEFCSPYKWALTISIFGIPTKPCSSWSEQLDSISLEMLIVVSVWEQLAQCCEVVGETLPNSVRGFIGIGGKQPQHISRTNYSSTSLKVSKAIVACNYNNIISQTLIKRIHSSSLGCTCI